MLTCRSCGKGSPLGASHCHVCGAKDFSKGPAALAVGCLSRALAWTAVIFTARLLFAGGWLLRGSDRLFRYVFDRSPWELAERVAWTLLVVWAGLAILQAILGERARVLESYGKILIWAFHIAKVTIAWAARLAWYAVEGLPAEPARSQRKGKTPEDRNVP